MGSGWTVVALAVGLAISPLASGYFDLSAWGPVALGAMALLIALLWLRPPIFTRVGIVASGGLTFLLALSAASMLWAESKESAWTSTNRLAFYAVVFAIVLLGVRDRRAGRLIMLILGAAALLTSLCLCLSFVLGGGQGAFLTRRLNAPIGYINGTAGLLVMGAWPWLAYAETARHRVARAIGIAGTSVIASTVVLTQSRAVVPATVLSAVLVLLCAPQRTRRAINLLLVAAGVAVTLPWTLSVYSSGGAAVRALPPSHGSLRAAALAILVAALGAGGMRLALTAAVGWVRPERRVVALRRIGRTLAVAAMVSIGIGSVVGGPWLAREYRSFSALQVNQNASVRFIDASGFRYDLWRVAVREFRSHPLGGLGAGNYAAEYYRLRNNPEYVLQPHSLELQMGAELGVGAILALLLFCGAVIAGGVFRLQTLASEDRFIKVAAVGMFTAWLVATSVDWLYDIPGVTGMAIAAAALLVVPAQGTPAAPAVARWRRRGPALVLGLIVVGLLAASVGRQYVASRYARAGDKQIAHSPEAAIKTLTGAAQLDPYSLTTLYALASVYARQDDYGRARATS